jgi:electron transfer flavoprotein beta subunit
MLVITLVKGVPGRTAKVLRKEGVLQRQEMEMVLNPNDHKALEAADFLRRRAGGKIVALTMGPDTRLKPVLSPLLSEGGAGVDEIFILSDPRCAGSDTAATSYTVSLAVTRAVERHTAPFDELVTLIKVRADVASVTAKAKELWDQNLLPNKVYSDLPSGGESIIKRFAAGSLSADAAVQLLTKEKETVLKYVVVAGIRTSDGETGSVGPQVAEAIAQRTGKEFPHATYVEDLDVDIANMRIYADRRIGKHLQYLEIDCPCLLTMAPEYRARRASAIDPIHAADNNYKGKIPEPMKWTADDVHADPARLGFPGSTVIVGPAVIVGKPATQKLVEQSTVFVRRVEKLDWEGKEFGPFEKGELADSLPQSLKEELTKRGSIANFSLRMLAEELFA